MNDTIYALSSGALPAGIAVVRVSGPGAFAALRSVSPALPRPRVATLRTLHGPDGVIDRALVIAFPGPASATGEDVVEFHLHGGVTVVAALFAALERKGARLAQPGEFTRRAFDAGRLDLTQVEGLADLIVAETEGQRRVALRQAAGDLRNLIDNWRDRLIDMLASVEATLDFADEGDVEDTTDRLPIATLLAEIDIELARAGQVRALRDGLTIAVTGPPNVGKSSLVNMLARREVALVSPVAGTTRDAIEVRLQLGGVLVTLVDTAGLRETDDALEASGVAIARKRAENADLVLALYCEGEPGAGIAVRTKSDLGGDGTGIAVSSTTGAGINDLENRLRDWATCTASPAAAGLLAQHRVHAAVTRARGELADAAYRLDPVLQAEALRLAIRALGEITGANDVEAVLDAIFARFCIGK